MIQAQFIHQFVNAYSDFFQSVINQDARMNAWLSHQARSPQLIALQNPGSKLQAFVQHLLESDTIDSDAIYADSKGLITSMVFMYQLQHKTIQAWYNHWQELPVKQLSFQNSTCNIYHQHSRDCDKIINDTLYPQLTAYKSHLLGEIHKTQLTFRLSKDLTQLDPREYEDHATKLAAKKFNRILLLQKALDENQDPVQAFYGFRQIFQQDYTKSLLSCPRDSVAKRIMANISYAIGTVFGVGLYVANKQKGSFQFWKNHGEILYNAVDDSCASLSDRLPLVFSPPGR